MNAQERETLNALLQQLVAVRVDDKDAEAESLIRDATRRQPDAAYLLVQKVLLQEQALRSAQAQLREAESRNPPSFLDNNAWGANAGRNVAGATAPTAPPAPGSGWLGSVATTAAGVVAGAFLFQGIEHLLGRHPAATAANPLSGGRDESGGGFFASEPGDTATAPEPSLDSLAASVDDYDANT